MFTERFIQGAPLKLPSSSTIHQSRIRGMPSAVFWILQLCMSSWIIWYVVQAALFVKEKLTSSQIAEWLKKERQRDTGRQRQTDRETYREYTDTERERERLGDTERQKKRQREAGRQTYRQTEREDTGTDRERDTERD